MEMAGKIRSGVLRYGLAVGVFVLLLMFPFVLQQIFSVSFVTTSLIIIAMIACAWYLGRGPGLLIAIAEVRAILLHYRQT